MESFVIGCVRFLDSFVIFWHLYLDFVISVYLWRVLG